MVVTYSNNVKCCLVKPNTTIDATLLKDISDFYETAAHTGSNEAGAQTTCSSVTHINLEYQNVRKDRDIDNMVKKFVNQGVISIPLRKVFHSWTFGNVILGNLRDEAEARNRSMFLDYAITEWPKATGKVSPLLYYNLAYTDTAPPNAYVATEWTYSYNGGNVSPISYVYKSTFTRCTVLIAKGSELIDDFLNSVIDSLGILEVWS